MHVQAIERKFFVQFQAEQLAPRKMFTGRMLITASRRVAWLICARPLCSGHIAHVGSMHLLQYDRSLPSVYISRGVRVKQNSWSLCRRGRREERAEIYKSWPWHTLAQINDAFRIVPLLRRLSYFSNFQPAREASFCAPRKNRCRLSRTFLFRPAFYPSNVERYATPLRFYGGPGAEKMELSVWVQR